MELKIWINDVEIEEPIGFDGFKTRLERGTEHGMGAEVSVASLEFVGAAAETIRDAYYADLDTVLIFKAAWKRDGAEDFDEPYIGVVDLATFEELTGPYCSVSCRIGGIGAKTTFNNRAETEITLTDGVMKDLDGEDLPSVQLSRSITMPAKEILIRSKNRASVDTSDTVVIRAGNVYVRPALDLQEYAEYGSLLPAYTNGFSGDAVVDFTNENVQNAFLIFDTRVRIKNVTAGLVNKTVQARIIVRARTGPGDSYADIVVGDIVTTSLGETKDISLSGRIPIAANAQISVFVRIYIDMVFGGELVTMEFTTLKGSYVTVERLETLAASKAKVVLVGDALSRMAAISAGLAVRSTWYDANTGGGACKALVTGLQLRNASALTESSPVLNISFKDLYLGLKAMDNIGWGFSEEDDETVIRIERQGWFYQDTTTMTINGPAEKTRKIDAAAAYSRFSFGYAKYMAVEDVNSADTFHTERAYSSGLKALDNELAQLCKFIADPYAIEFTRRKSLDKTTEDWRYDENTFVIALRKYEEVVPGPTPFHRIVYAPEIGIDNSDGTIISPETLLNVRISPERNALRWAESLFKINKPAFNMTSSTGNVAAKGKPMPTTGMVLEDSAEGAVLAENDQIGHTAPKLKAETLSFTWPMTLAEYRALKQSPYGKIIVDGETTYLKKVEYDFTGGLASMTVIPADG